MKNLSSEIAKIFQDDPELAKLLAIFYEMKSVYDQSMMSAGKVNNYLDIVANSSEIIVNNETKPYMVIEEVEEHGKIP